MHVVCGRVARSPIGAPNLLGLLVVRLLLVVCECHGSSYPAVPSVKRGLVAVVVKDDEEASVCRQGLPCVPIKLAFRRAAA